MHNCKGVKKKYNILPVYFQIYLDYTVFIVFEG